MINTVIKMNFRFEVSVVIKRIHRIDILIEAVMPNVFKFTFRIYKTGPPFWSQSRKLEDPFSILIKTILFISFSQIS